TSVDYRISDPYLDPPGATEHLHTETLLRLPHHTCFVPFEGSPPIESRSGRKTAPIFGSVNQWSKVTDQVKDVWSALLKHVEGAQLFVIARGAQNRAMKDRVLADFVERGVFAKQVEVFPML